MSTESTKQLTEAAAVADIVSQAVLAAGGERPIQRTDAGGAPFTVLIAKDGSQRVESLAAFDPPMKRAHASFSEKQSFIDYVEIYADAHSRIFCDVKAMRFTAILDYHDPASDDAHGRRGDHVADFAMKITPTMEAWLNLSKQPIAQSALAEFLEDRYGDIEEPEGAAILELAKGLEVTNDVAFSSSQRRADGGYDLTYKETVSTKSGQAGTIEVPSRFLLAVQVFEGGAIVRLPVRLRFRLAGSALFFALTFIGLEDRLRDEVQRVRESIADATKRQVWAGGAVIC